jgi:hypothetical protein
LWFLPTYGKKVTTRPVESTVHPSWMKQSVAYAAEEPTAAKAAATSPDRTAELLRQQAVMQQQL